MKKNGLYEGCRILLRKNISKSQMAGYCISNLIGLTIILSGIQFFCDTRNHGSKEDSYFSDDYIVISKKVTGVNLEPVSFSEDEINEISRQKWVKKTGAFTASNFSVSGSVLMGDRGMSTQMFLESVPDDFFDRKPDNWNFNPEKRFIPIVLNKDYLALYNFGFAIPQGLPQLSEDIIQTVPLRLYVRGDNGKTETFDAGVVGFSSRLNTIAVPEDFMTWANERFSTEPTGLPSRLILKIDGLESSKVEDFIVSNGYEIAGDKGNSSKLSDFMGVVAAVITSIGILIFLLSLFILILSIYLILQKSRTMLRDLLLFGYSPLQVGKNYESLVKITNALIIFLSIGLTFIFQIFWKKPLMSLELGHGSVLPMLGAAAIFYGCICIVSIMIIRSRLKRIWFNS